MISRAALIAASGISVLTHICLAQSFSAPARISDGARNYRLSRTSNNVAAFDSTGALQLAYWAGEGATTSSTPSFIFHREWTPGGGWGAETTVDDSFVGPDRLGGRHPTLAVASDDGLWIVWHDHRHSTAAQGWTDNVEIFGDSRPAGGAFSADDDRLTTTSAAHAGDNGFTPRIAREPFSDRLSLAWYDFNADGGVSDIYLKTSDTPGVFASGESIAVNRATDLADRGGTTAYTVPDLAVDATGVRHLVWVGGTGQGGDVYYASAAPGSPALVETVIASGAGDFLDPPHIAASPGGGEIWIAFADGTAVDGGDISVLRRLSGAASFNLATVIALPGVQAAVDAEPGAGGLLHLAWIDERAGRHVYYGVFDPGASALVSEGSVTADAGDWARPTLALGADGSPHIIYEENTSSTAGDIWHAAPPPPAAESEDWSRYD